MFRTAMTTLIALSAAAAGDSRAALVQKTYFNHAVAACQPALPVFDGLIRKRPKAIANEGTATAFVSCAPGVTPAASERVRYIEITMTNRSGAAIPVTCTLVDGRGDSDYSTARTKTVQIPSGTLNFIIWNYTVDNGLDEYTAPAISCALPPGVEVSGLATTAMDEIGS